MHVLTWPEIFFLCCVICLEQPPLQSQITKHTRVFHLSNSSKIAPLQTICVCIHATACMCVSCVCMCMHVCMSIHVCACVHVCVCVSTCSRLCFDCVSVLLLCNGLCAPIWRNSTSNSAFLLLAWRTSTQF